MKLPEPNQIVKVLTIFGAFSIVRFITASDNDYFWDNMHDEIFQSYEVKSWKDFEKDE